tara:strand:+ start:223 stop:360 length:138 start_codon:yes stop_codon:yes gene_type:complete
VPDRLSSDSHGQARRVVARMMADETLTRPGPGHPGIGIKDDEAST